MHDNFFTFDKLPSQPEFLYFDTNTNSYCFGQNTGLACQGTNVKATLGTDQRCAEDLTSWSGPSGFLTPKLATDENIRISDL